MKLNVYSVLVVACCYDKIKFYVYIILNVFYFYLLEYEISSVYIS